MWLSRLFERLRTADRLRLIVPIYSQFLGWMGGEIYISNFIRLLSSLPDERRPELILMQMSHLGSRLDDFALRLAEHDAVVAIIDRSGSPRFIKPHLRKRLGTAKGVSGTRWSTYLAGVRATFPVLYIETEARFLPNPVFWIPDFQHRCLPQLFEAAEVAERDAYFTAISRSGHCLILSSEAALADYRRFFPAASTRDYVWRFHSFIAEDANAAPDSISEFRLPNRYYYVANQFWAHKDHTTAFRALAKARATGRPMQIVCTGGGDDYRNSGYFLSLISLLEEEGIKASVHFLGLVSRQQQASIFRHAAAVIQPSQFEGWSTVIEDAKALGCPVIASDLAVHREQLENQGFFFKTGDADDLARVVLETWDRVEPRGGLDHETNARRRTMHLLNAAAAKFLTIMNDQPQIAEPPWHFGAAAKRS
jgi:glycosyltransferase involved in cell wall biosynthesis